MGKILHSEEDWRAIPILYTSYDGDELDGQSADRNEWWSRYDD
jgi:hypothetical protein